MSWQLAVPDGIRDEWVKARKDAWRNIPPPLLANQDHPKNFEPDQSLIDAANVAIELGQPLLLTGEPGAGKTTFAGHLAWQIDVGAPLRYQARTDMDSRDLFYRYDNLARFRAANERKDLSKPWEFVTLNALGEAIVRASDPDVFGELRERLLPGIGTTRRRSVVLLDEIDKAPRDVPNDLLGHITPEKMWFELPELANREQGPVRIEASGAFQPIVICTSNSEKSLPDAFLRRCVFYEIGFPSEATLRRIISLRVTKLAEHDQLTTDVMGLVSEIRAREPTKKPGLAETLGFAVALQARGYVAESALAPGGDWYEVARTTLLKVGEDRRNADNLFGRFGRAAK